MTEPTEAERAKLNERLARAMGISKSGLYAGSCSTVRPSRVSAREGMAALLRGHQRSDGRTIAGAS